jgi:virulence-associated protein VapD
MFAIAFDPVVRETQARHPKSVPAAYADIERALAANGFEGTQGSVHLTVNEDLACVTRAMNALKALAWFPDCVRDIRAFRVENWSDFTGFMKEA